MRDTGLRQRGHAGEEAVSAPGDIDDSSIAINSYQRSGSRPLQCTAQRRLCITACTDDAPHHRNQHRRPRHDQAGLTAPRGNRPGGGRSVTGWRFRCLASDSPRTNNASTPHKQIAPPKQGFRRAADDYCLRLRATARPASPRPRSASVPGSGTGAAFTNMEKPFRLEMLLKVSGNGSPL